MDREAPARDWAGQLACGFGYHLLQRFGRLMVAQARMPSSPAVQFVSMEAARGLLQKGAAPAEWNLTVERFRLVLERSVAHRFTRVASGAHTNSSSKQAHDSPLETRSITHSGAAPDARAIEAYLDSLHAADLALACACSEGNAAAWDFFMAVIVGAVSRGASDCGRSWWARAGGFVVCRTLRVARSGRAAQIVVRLFFGAQQIDYMAACDSGAAPCGWDSACASDRAVGGRRGGGANVRSATEFAREFARELVRGRGGEFPGPGAQPLFGDIAGSVDGGAGCTGTARSFAAGLLLRGGADAG